MDIHGYDRLIIQAVKKVSPSVVSIVISKYLPKVKTIHPVSFTNPFLFEDTSSDAREKTKVGGGSGFVVHTDGIILTNKHVVLDEDAEYTVVTSDGGEHAARVISRDPVRDLAILKTDAKGLKPIPMGDATKLELGQTVIAIGNALGMFSNSVSKGIISGLARSISASLGSEGSHTEELRGVIQTDVAINQGNSGGPLINLDGEAVAINTAVIFGAQNIGFSIPIDWAKQDLHDILKHGRIIKPYIGLMYVMLNKKAQEKYTLASDHGALVIRDHLPNSTAVIPNSPAEKAGVQENDIITAVNDEALAENTDLTDVLQKYPVDKKVTLSILRKGSPLTVDVTLEERK